MPHAIAQTLPVTIELALGSLLLALIVAVPFGLLLATSRSKLLDRLGAVYGTVGVSIPSCWLALVLLVLFAVDHRWFPTGGFVPLFRSPAQNLSHMFLPMVSIALPVSAALVLMIRAAIPATRSARASRSLAIFVPGVILGGVLSQIVTVEPVFSVPGLGLLMISSISELNSHAVWMVVIAFAVFALIVGLPGWGLRIALSLDSSNDGGAGDGVGAHPVLPGLLRRPWWVLGAIILALLALVAIFAPFLAPHDPLTLNVTALSSGARSGYPLGTDSLGRDILSRLIFGARDALGVSALAVLIALVLGLPLGLAVRFFHGSVGRWLIMPIVDLVQAFPFLILVVALADVFPFGWGGACAAIALGLMPAFVRAAGTQILTLPPQGYVESRAGGLAGVILGQTALAMAAAVLADAALSFVGLGATPPTPTWGGMLNSAMQEILSVAHVFWPGFAVFLAVLAFVLLRQEPSDA